MENEGRRRLGALGRDELGGGPDVAAHHHYHSGAGVTSIKNVATGAGRMSPPLHAYMRGEEYVVHTRASGIPDRPYLPPRIDAGDELRVRAERDAQS